MFLKTKLWLHENDFLYYFKITNSRDQITEELNLVGFDMFQEKTEEIMGHIFVALSLKIDNHEYELNYIEAAIMAENKTLKNMTIQDHYVALIFKDGKK